MEAKISSFDRATGQVLVAYTDAETGNVWHYAIDLPIVNGEFPEGTDMDKILQASAPVWQVERMRLVALATNADAVSILAPVLMDNGVVEVPRETQIRNLRDLKLQQSDWTQLADFPYTEATKSAWATYRLALRELPQQSGFPEVLVWPVAPL